MSSKSKPYYILNNIIVYVCYGIIFLIFQNVAAAQNTGPTSIVYKLYKDYGWEALFYNSDGEDASKYLGKSIAQQPKKILNLYFDDELANLLAQEAACVKNNPGEMCKLNFDPIFVSQDVSAYDLKITDINNGKISAEYTYPSNHEKIKLIFFVVKKGKEWRISDINYKQGNSLKKILSHPLPN